MLDKKDKEITGLAKQQLDNLQKRIDQAEDRMDGESYDTKRHIEDMRKELEHFKEEKERVRSIVGKIGAVPTQRNRLLNGIFLFVVIACIPLSLITHGIIQHLILEIAIAAVSLKLIWIIHNQGRVNHFQLWILTSIEWRMNEMMREIRDLHSKIDEFEGNVGNEENAETSQAQEKKNS